MAYVGDFRLGDTFDTKFCTVTTTGAPTTLAGTPVISAYVGNSTTEITAGITLSVDFDSRTGMNNVRVVATGGNGYATASNYQLVITTGTVGGTSVVGYVVAEFSIENRSAVMPTTAARTLDVSAGGEAGVDWANVGSPTTSLALTGTTIAVTQKVDVDTIKTNPVVNGGTITFPTNATLASTTNITAGTITTTTNLTNAVTLSAGDSPVVATGTATAGSATTITLQTALGADDLVKGALIKITSGTGAKQTRGIGTYVDSTKVVFVDRNWTVTPDATSVYAILSENLPKLDASLKVSGVVLVDTLTTYTGNTPQTGDGYARLGAPAGASVSADVAAVKVDTAAVKVQTDKLTFTVANQVDSNVLDWKSATAPAMTGDAYARIGANGAGLTSVAVGVGGIAATSFTAGSIDAAAIAADAIGSSEFAAGAVTKIWANACTEPAAPVAASPTAIAAVSWLLTQSRNKITQTATTQLLLADDGVTTIATSTVSDDGTTAVRGEFV